ncbi:CBS domain-containing protein [bacterium]|nr:CBS domain-containing protein [bacterium]
MLDKLAGDILIPLKEYPHILHYKTIKEAMEIMVHSELIVDGIKSRPRALLVIDDEQHLLGIVRRRDILRGIEPKFLRVMPVHHRHSIFDIQTDSHLIDMHIGNITNEMKCLSDSHISEVMSRISTTVKVDDHLAKIAFKMISRDIDVIVVMEGKKPIGIVRTVDVLNAVWRLLENND